MINNQPIASSNYSDDIIRVHSIFYTIQGEGPFTGRPALFVRLNGCNLRCYWCDTEYTEKLTKYSNEELLAEICKQLEHCAPETIVVITGGEPMAQNISYLTRALATVKATTVQIETNGTVMAPNFPWLLGNVHLVVSPKTGKLAPEYSEEKLQQKVIAWKYILQWTDKSNDGLPILATQVSGKIIHVARPPNGVSLDKIYVSPVDDHGPEATVNIRKVVRVALEHGYTVNLQTHKILEVE